MRTLGKAKKGISPVIATIILIAITIVIAIAVAAWVFGLFKSYSGNANGVTILSGVSSCSNNQCIIVLSNQGSNSVSVIGASINGVALPANSISGTTNIGANTQDTITLNGYSFTPGQTLNIAIALNNGATVTTTIIAS
jgi:archaeal flagellin N-terminal-like domain